MRPKRKEYIVAEPPLPCPERPCYPTCTEICEEVLLWIDQDHKGPNSNLVLENGSEGKGLHDTMGGDYLDTIALNRRDDVIEYDPHSGFEAWEEVKRLRLSEKMTRVIYSYYVEGRRLRDIAINEGITSQAVDVRHNQARKSIAWRLGIERSWDKYLNSIEKDVPGPFGSIRDYESLAIFFRYHLPRKIVAKILGMTSGREVVNISTRVNAILSEFPQAQD